jgi:hypothetical protein
MPPKSVFLDQPSERNHTYPNRKQAGSLPDERLQIINPISNQTHKWPGFFFKKVLFFCCLLPQSQSFRSSSDKTRTARHGQESMRPKELRSEFFMSEDLASGDLVSLDL